MNLLTPEQKMSNLLKVIGNPAICGNEDRKGCGATIKKLQRENLKTIEEARAIIARYQEGIDLGAKAIALMEAKIKRLECEAIGRSWNATNENKNGEGHGQC